MDKAPFQSSYRRRTRLPDYDYSSPGAYFITICTHSRECILGFIEKGEMQLNPPGEIVSNVWSKLPDFYTCIELDAFVVMPDHIHAVIILLDSPTANKTREGRGPSPTTKFLGLPAIVRGFKSMAANRINTYRQTPGAPVWQRSFYDHVIRNPNDLSDIRKYIAENPLRWESARNNENNI